MKGKIYLLYPPISMMERYSTDVGSVGGKQLPLGIYYLASYIRNHNYEVFIADAEALKLSALDIIREINLISPNFVGISSTTVAFHRALEVAKIIKENFPDIKIILGGPHISSNYKHAMSFDAFDYGVIGEGEITFLELLNYLSNGKKARNIDIKGIAYRNKDNEIIKTTPREYISDLNVLPLPAYDLVKDIKLYTPPPSNYRTLPVINMITSRGCPYSCTFCDKGVFGRKYRERSAENIFEEIKYLWNQYKIKEIAFVDDTFLINKKRIYDLFELLKNEGLFFHWSCMARIDNVDFGFLKFLKTNGCWNIAFGIESSDENILTIIKKDICLKTATQVIEWCNKLKIKTKGFFIVGHPAETVETINKTIEFACKTKLDAVVVTINTPMPGSQQHAEADKYGTLDTADWAQFNYWRPVFVPNGLTEDILLKKQKEFYIRFYLRPRIIINYVASFFGKGGLKRLKSILGLTGYLLENHNFRVRH